MTRKLLISALFLVIAIACSHAQTDDTYMTETDSAAFVNTRWQTERMQGYELRRHHFNHEQIFGANENFSIIVIPANSKRKIAFAIDSVLTETSVQAKRKGAIAAINGTFFDMDKGYSMCFIKIDSTILGDNVPSKKDTVNRKYYQSGSIVLANGKTKLIHTEKSRVWERRLQFSDIMTAGPLLIHKGQIQKMRDDRTFVTDRHNRTALGIRKDGSIVLLVVDGRFKESEGLTLPELTQVMRWMGCIEAINLDGGGSSTMYVKDYGSNGIVNYPSDNRKYDHEGERPVSSIIYLL